MAVSKALSFESTVTINELRVAIPLLGETITPVIISEPGVGKSSLLAMLAEDNGDQWRKAGDKFDTDKYEYVYLDCPLRDVMDMGAYIPVHEGKTLEYYLSGLLHLK